MSPRGHLGCMTIFGANAVARGYGIDTIKKRKEERKVLFCALVRF